MIFRNIVKNVQHKKPEVHLLNLSYMCAMKSSARNNLLLELVNLVFIEVTE